MEIVRKARLAGFLYLLTLGSAFAAVVRTSLTVRGDPLASASKIIAAEQQFRIAFAADLISAAAYVGVAVLLYQLLRPAGRTTSLVAACFALVGSAVMAASLVSLLGTLMFLDPASAASQLEPGEAHILAIALFRLHGLGFVVATFFFGIYCSLLGWLILRSTFLPRLIGGLLALTGACYLINALAIFLAPNIAAMLAGWVLTPALLGEGGLILWLLIKGVDPARWQEQAAAEAP